MPDGFARHIKGGWFFYECLGPTSPDGSTFRYRVHLKLYRDCNPSSNGQDPPSMNFTIFRAADNVQVQNVSAPKTSEYTLSKKSFSNCINPAPNICYIIFEYNTIVELPATAGGYTISAQRCCRIDGIVNMQAPSNTVGISYTVTIPGNNINASYPNNNSPIFAEKDTAITCYNSTIELDYSAKDIDGDVLVYSFAPAITGGNSGSPSPAVATAPPYPSVSYYGNFSASNPFGTSLQINPNTGIITGTTPSITGEYVLAVSIKEYRNGVFISETRKELHVVVANCSLVAAKLPPRISACKDFSVSFENGSVSPSIHSYFWDFGVPNISTDTSRLPTPTYVYPDTGTFTVKLIVNKGDECADSTTSKIAVYPGFKPGFTIFGSCLVNPFQFTDTTRSTYGQVNKWRWDFGEATQNNDTSIAKSPAFLYPTLGNKTVSLIVEDDKGCFDTVTKTLEVLIKPPLNLAFKDTLICSIDTLQLQAGSSGTYAWTPDIRIINRFTATPSVFPIDTMTYYVTVTDGGCINTDSVRVNVLDSIQVDAGLDTTICRTDGAQLRAVSYGLQYQWTPIASLNNAFLKNPIAKPTAASTVYYVTANLGKCKAQDSVTVKTIPYPGSNAGQDTTICYNTFAYLHGSMNGVSFNWTPKAPLLNSNTLNPSVKLTSTASFILTVYDTIGCPKPFRDTVIVHVLPRMNVFAGNDTSVVINQPLLWQLPDIPVVTKWQWTPAQSLSNANIHNPTALFSLETLFNGEESILYTLTGTSAIGCTESDQVLVKIFKTGPSIFVPGAFTPNGDGSNDVMRPILVGMRSLDVFKVYNRYGQLVFETTTINKGWDGKINGEPQPSAGYVYAAIATDYTGKVVKQTGSFLLIR